MQKIADGKLTSLDARVCQVLFPFNLLTREGGERRIEEEVGEEVEKEEEEKKEEGGFERSAGPEGTDDLC